MADDTAQGQEPSAQTAAGQAPAATPAPVQDTPAIDYEKQIKELRDENAKARIKNRELQDAAGDNKALRDQLAALQAERDQITAEKEAALKGKGEAQKEAQLVRLAVKAGIDADALLDVLKLDPSDEKKALEVLGKLVVKQAGNQARPGAAGNTGLTEADIWNQRGGNRESAIWGR